jgi:hypothetical protein
MKKIIIFSIFSTLSFFSSCQFSIDSLKNEVSKLIISDIKYEFGTEFTKYINQDSLVLFEVYYNDSNQISNSSWGIAFVEKKYDAMGRIIESKSYNALGLLKGADSPPIVKIIYLKDNITQKNYYNGDMSFSGRIEVYFDSLGREVKFIGYDKLLNREMKKVTEFIDSVNVTLVKYYDADDKLDKNEFGVSVWYTKYSSRNHDFITETQVLNKKMKLVDCLNDGYDKKEKSYSKVLYIKLANESKIKVQQINKKNIVVNEFYIDLQLE